MSLPIRAVFVFFLLLPAIRGADLALFPSGSLRLEGRRLLDATDTEILLRGAEIRGSLHLHRPSESELKTDQHLNARTFTVMRRLWNMNVVRLPTSSYAWKANPAGYLDRLEKIVRLANEAQLIVILALYEDQRAGRPAGQRFSMPTTISAEYWKAVAERFRNNPHVMFDLYDAPDFARIPAGPSGMGLREPETAIWKHWTDGGIYEGQQHLGLGDLVRAVRSVGASQILLVQGLNGGTTFWEMVYYSPFFRFRRSPVTPPQDGSVDLGILYTVRMDLLPNYTRNSWQYAMPDGDLQPYFVVNWNMPAELHRNAFCPDTIYSHYGGVPNHFITVMHELKTHWTAAAFVENGLIEDFGSFKPTDYAVAPRNGESCGFPPPVAGLGQSVRQKLMYPAVDPSQLTSVGYQMLTSSAARSAPIVAPGALASAYGFDLADTAESAAGSQWPLSLAGVQVRVVDSLGAERSARITSVSPTRIDYLFPEDLASGFATITIAGSGKRITSQSLVTPVTPGIFTADGTDQGPAAGHALLVANDGSQQLKSLSECSARGRCSPIPVKIGADARQTYLILYGTGIRNAKKVTCRLGTVQTPVIYAGPSRQFPGVDQVNLLLPADQLNLGAKIKVFLEADGESSNPVLITLDPHSD